MKLSSALILSCLLVGTEGIAAVGDSMDNPVIVPPLFFHEIPDFVDRWIAQNIKGPNHIVPRNDKEVFRHEKGREFEVELIALADGTKQEVWFDRTAEVSSEARNIEELFVFPEYLSIVKEATTIEATLLKIQKDQEPYYLELGYRSLSTQQAGALQRILLSAESYNWDSHSLCWPAFYVRAKIHRGTDTLEMNFCFHCGQLGILKDHRRLPWRDFHQAEFVKLFGEIFPDDPFFREALKKNNAN